MAGDAFTVIAHRGQSSQRPENTFAAFDLAVEQGFTHLETDVQLSSDGVPLILHDGNLRRVAAPTAAAGPAAQRTAADLADVDVGSWLGAQYASERIPRLDQMLDRYRGRVHLHLELKSEQPALPGAVAAALGAGGWLEGLGPARPAGGASAECAAEDLGSGFRAPDGAFGVPGLTLTSFHVAQLQRARELLPHVRLAWLVHDITDRTIAEARAARIDQLCPRANIVTEAAVGAAMRAGFSVRGWGVKSIELLRRLQECGAQGCTADWPDKARAALCDM